ncbi:MAG: DotU family type IV/VI secretion system protein [Candidatus Nealsonbacteria bacterium]|nr:DotU family type IV/VI secretion system protein [Candidatus Nealsonbacteria bacterium]
MTPKFAKAVDPVFMRVLGLLERIERDRNLSPEEERVTIRSDLDAAERRLGQSEEWKLAKYGLVSWIDEVLIEAPWEKGRNWWKENSLEWVYFGTNSRFERFFEQAEEANKQPQKDALEVFYVCLVLGFRGLYRDPEQAPALAGPLGIPTRIGDWASQKAKAIHGGDRPNISEGHEPIDGAEPLEGPVMLIWSVLLALVLAAVTGFVAWMFCFPSSFGGPQT